MQPPTTNDLLGGLRVLMLLDNPCDPDPRVQREAKTLVEAGAKVTILAWHREGDADPETWFDGVHIVRIPPLTQRQIGWRQVGPLLRFYGAAWRTARRRPADVVVAHDLRMLPLGALVARQLRAALVYDAHEIYRWMDVGRLPDWWLRSAEWAERLLIDHAVDLFVSPSLQHVDAYWGSLVKRPPIVVGNWYDPVDVDVEAARRRHGLDGLDGRIIGYAGAIDPSRRLDLLIALARRRPDVNVAIAGRGNDESVELVRRASIDLPNLFFLGWVDNPIEFLAAADAVYYAVDLDQPYARFSAPNALYIAIAVDHPMLASVKGEVEWMHARTRGVVLLSEPTEEAIVEAVDRLPPPGGCWGEMRQRYTWAEAATRYLRAFENLVDGRPE